MDSYYVNRNAQPGGEHEVHKEGCPTPPNAANRDALGRFTHCSGALSAARAKGYPSVDGCKHCSPACHSR